MTKIAKPTAAEEQRERRIYEQHQGTQKRVDLMRAITIAVANHTEYDQLIADLKEIEKEVLKHRAYPLIQAAQILHRDGQHTIAAALVQEACEVIRKRYPQLTIAGKGGHT